MRYFLLLLFLSGCVYSTESPSIHKTLTDKYGQTQGYIYTDGSVTDTVGRTVGYIE